ncbi:tRNA pseudouridine(38-40) synthase TruA [Halostella sp. JP-L12]|uniref:tRNA pseudouridine(38-40) synthase TruA n=1 Tax=Halostella TaxID=1843185 RepID=UPI000EF7D232|nr:MULTISPECIES: tRNA pseudouridine(38-40) synthase TruA [Halostella]NHN46951.1 tRNA pseudouridine(38-40) synthase TruA [Halostella sp. JP-L12]
MDAYRIAYDGRPYHGFQRQPDVPTVEDAVFDALRDLGVSDGAPPGYAAAGRTDAGVSAVAQTVAFDAPEWLSPAAFNGELPASVRAWARADAPDGFHATHHATAREYVYHLYAPDADAGRARTALDRLRGEHDFHNLTPDDEGTVRDLDASLVVDGDYLVLTFRAGGFARQLVRRLVSLARAVATGEAAMEKIERVLAPEPLPGHEGIPPAPAYPLVLVDAEYPDLTFAVDEDAAESAQAVFGGKRVEWRTRARVAGEMADRL